MYVLVIKRLKRPNKNIALGKIDPLHVEHDPQPSLTGKCFEMFSHV